MRWRTSFYLSLVLFLAVSVCGYSQEITQSKRAELIEIFDQLEKTVNRQADTIETLKSQLAEQSESIERLRNSLTAQSETINNLNLSLTEAEKSLREERKANERRLFFNRAGFFVGGSFAGLVAAAVLM